MAQNWNSIWESVSEGDSKDHRMVWGERILKITEFHSPFNQTRLLHHCPPETLLHMEHKCLKVSFFQQVLTKSCYKANPLNKLGKGCGNYRVMLTTGDKMQLK